MDISCGNKREAVERDASLVMRKISSENCFRLPKEDTDPEGEQFVKPCLQRQEPFLSREGVNAA